MRRKPLDFDPDTLSVAEVAFAAGLFEGEGSVTATGGWSARIGMTDIEPLQRMLVFGGHIGGPYPKRPPRKPSWTWAIHGYETVKMFYSLIHEYLSPRRRAQFEHMLARKPYQAPESPDCGRHTIAGVGAHRRKNEPLCAGCRQAFNAYQYARNHGGAVYSP